MNKNMKIMDLEVATGKQLTSDVKKSLIKVVEDEFANQTSKMSEVKRDKEREWLEEYHKKVNFSKLEKELIKTKVLGRSIVKKIELLGLGGHGQLLNVYDARDKVTQSLVVSLLKDRDKMTTGLSKPRTYKNEVIARLLMASTNGEACVILREVMSNGLIPVITKEQLKITEK